MVNKSSVEKLLNSVFAISIFICLWVGSSIVISILLNGVTNKEIGFHPNSLGFLYSLGSIYWFLYQYGDKDQKIEYLEEYIEKLRANKKQ